MTWIAVAALTAGMALAAFANWRLDLGQSIREQLECGWIWGGAMIVHFVLGAQMLSGF